jgi:hypothetical protein
MKSPIVLFLLFLSSIPEHSFAGGWVLTTPDFTITETEFIPTKKWVVLESFGTASQCNDRRSSMITDLDKERRELRKVGDHNAAIESEREVRVLSHIYINSKCVSLTSARVNATIKLSTPE